MCVCCFYTRPPPSHLIILTDRFDTENAHLLPLPAIVARHQHFSWGVPGHPKCLPPRGLTSRSAPTMPSTLVPPVLLVAGFPQNTSRPTGFCPNCPNPFTETRSAAGDLSAQQATGQTVGLPLRSRSATRIGNNPAASPHPAVCVNGRHKWSRGAATADTSLKPSCPLLARRIPTLAHK